MKIEDIPGKILEKLVDNVVDLNNFRIREPYKKIVSETTGKAFNKIKDSKVAKFIGEEPNIKKIRQALTPKTKVVNPIKANDNTCLYAILGVPKNSSQVEIKAAYQKQTKIHHPDKSQLPNKDEIFKRVQRAFTVLSNEAKRSLYDRHGIASLKPGFQPPED